MMRRRGLEEEEKAGITRRSFLRGAVAAGSVGFIGAAGFGTVVSLFSPPTECRGEVLSSFLYINPVGAELPVWYVQRDLVGKEARINDFDPGRGANVLWKATISEDGQIACGFSAMLMRRDPAELTFPEGFNASEFVIGGLYAIFNCCTHACCRPGWQLIPRPYPKGDQGFENIYCPCHDSQYNPRIISRYQHPPPPAASGAEYFGVHKEVGVGPAPRGMPLIPLELEGGKIIGRVKNQGWYQYLDSKNKTIPIAPGEEG